MEEKKTIVYKGVEHGDWVDCTHCGSRMLLPTTSGICPECRRESQLMWVNEEQEKDAKDLTDVILSDRELKPYECLLPEDLRERCPELYQKMVDDEEIRCCKVCGKPMSEGYYCDGEFYCSEECLYKDVPREEVERLMYQLEDDERLEDLDEEEKESRFYGQDVCYYTEWESAYNM